MLKILESLMILTLIASVEKQYRIRLVQYISFQLWYLMCVSICVGVASLSESVRNRNGIDLVLGTAIFLEHSPFGVAN